MRILASVIGVLLVAYLGFLALLYFKQRTFIYYPQPAAGAAGTRTIALERDGHRILVSALEKPGKDALIYFGGNAEDVSYSYPLLARTFPGHSVYLMHYRGYGGSAGSPTEKSLVNDAVALFDLVKANRPAVTVIGRSLGSGVALQLASKRPVAALVLVTPYNSILQLAEQQFRFFPVHWILQDKYESWRYAGKVKAPTLIIAGESDTLIPVANSLELLGHFPPGVARMEVIKGGDHNNLSEVPSYAAVLGSVLKD